MLDLESLPDHTTLMLQALVSLEAQTAAYDRTWQIGRARWNVDQDTGTIIFTTPLVMATAAVQIIGTYNSVDGTFMWGWDHPSVQPQLQVHANIVKRYGEARGIPELTTQVLRCHEARAWELTALANRLCGGAGGYRGPSGTTFVFMTFGKLTLQKAPA